MAAVKQLITSYSSTITDVWTGLEIINSSGARSDINNWGYFYRNGTFVSPTYLPWSPSQPVNTASYFRGAYRLSGGGIINTQESSFMNPVCEYEEGMKQPVSDLEQKCVNLPSSSFVDDVCFRVYFIDQKNYNDAKVSCNDLSGYNGHLAHVRSMGELWVADAIRSVSYMLIR
uniref:C-type lectin domain-containing protein n=1 Tax=Plectus sambesii TaxID=2011161 RepID=A0A914WV93_9BILA